MAKSKTSVPRVSYRKFLKRKQPSTAACSSKVAKRYLKFLAVCNNPKTASVVLRNSPDTVIKRICDAALNAANGPIPIPDHTKQQFQSKRALFNELIDPHVPIVRKRRHLSSQKGGALPLIPILLSTVLSTLGPLLFNR